MNKYAILQIKSKQYMVEEGANFKVPKLQEGDSVDVLVISENGESIVGTPNVEKGGVVLSNLGSKRIKTEVRRYKSKSRYRKNKSHTDEYSLIYVEKIDLSANSSIIKKQSEKSSVKKPVKEPKNKTSEKTKELAFSDLGLTEKQVENLKKAKITTVSDLKSKTKKDLLEVKGLGEKTVDSILKKLK